MSQDLCRTACEGNVEIVLVSLRVPNPMGYPIEWVDLTKLDSRLYPDHNRYLYRWALVRKCTSEELMSFSWVIDHRLNQNENEVDVQAPKHQQKR